MRSLVAIIVVVMSLASLGRTQNKERINRVITTARWIYVVSDEGDEFSGRVSLEDRQAITNLAGAIEKWGYYKITSRGQGAELVFVVHSEGDGGLLGGVNRTITRGDAGGDGDTLFVYDARQYPNGGALWRASMRNGLQAPRMPLFEQLKEQIEAASKPKACGLSAVTSVG